MQSLAHFIINEPDGRRVQDPSGYPRSLMQDVETMLVQAKTYRAAAATAPNRRIYELLLELAAEFQNAAMRVEGKSKPPRDASSDGRG
jgi:hypothetical protein